MQENVSFNIRPMTGYDLDQALLLAKSEGWNQTENDWKMLLDNSANICIVAEHKGRVAGTATALNHSGKVAWIGMVLVDKSLRGQGAGKKLMTSMLDALRGVESVKLDATPAGFPLYQSLGFIEEHRILRMTSSTLFEFKDHEAGVRPLPVDFKSLAEVINTDRVIFGVERGYLLDYLYQNYPHKAFLLRKDDTLDGFVMGRDGIRFNYVGPVYANSTETAIKLLSKALSPMNNQPVAIDITEDKEELVKWVESIGFIKQRHFSRMYLKKNPYPGIVRNQYLISGPEFG